MEGLTFKEIILLIVIIAAAVSLVVSLIKGSVRIFVAVAICVVLFSGFTWLPEKIQQWTGSEQEPANVNEAVNIVKNEASDFLNIEEEELDNKINATKNAVNTVDTFVKNEAPSWWDALKSLWAKITKNEVVVNANNEIPANEIGE